MNGYEMAFFICTFDNFTARYVFAIMILSSNVFLNTASKTKKCSSDSIFSEHIKNIRSYSARTVIKGQSNIRDVRIAFYNYLV